MGKILISAKPNAKNDEISSLDPVSIRIKAPATEGKANLALIRFLAKTLGLPQSAITITHGAANKKKILQIEGISDADIMSRLRAARGQLLP